MTPDLKPYSQYKESGEPWLGKVPEHWKICKLRRLLSSTNQRNRQDLSLLSVVRDQGVILRDLKSKEKNHNFIPDDLSNYKVVCSGQFVMNKMKAWQGSYGVSKYDGIVSPAYYVFNVHNVSGDFFNTALRSKAYIPFFNQASDGIRVDQWDLSQVRMREMPFFVPPLDEQNAIVRYLDYVDRRIQRYIRAKQKLITLLEEQKQAVIHQAVTRGLDDNVPLKASGVEWLGDIPEHWEVSSIGRISRVVRGQTPRPAGDPLYFDGDALPWITVGEVTKDDNKFLVQTKTKLTSEGVKHSRTFEKDTLVITNSGATLGVPKILGVKGCMNDGVAALLNVHENYSKNYLYFYFVSLTEHLREITKIGGQPNLNTTIVSGLPVPWPPIEEQKSIVRFLEPYNENHDLLVVDSLNEINLIEQYRARLIADVVTGKLDVRAAAAQLPDELEVLMEDDKGLVLEEDAAVERAGED